MATRKKLATMPKKSTTPGDLSERAMLVKLKISCWGAKTNDNDVAQEVAQMKHSDAELGKFTKSLLKSENRDSFRKAARECRRMHRWFTLPWDEGVGLLPSKVYFKYVEAITKKRQEAENFIDAFVKEYEEQWNAGMKDYRKALGSMFDAGDYPEPKRVRTKFGIQIRTFPIQDPNDFRVKMSSEVSEGLKAQMLDNFKTDLQDAMRMPVLRLHECLAKVKAKLDEPDAIFRDSLIENVKELVEVLPALNVLEDPEIAKLISDTDKEICSVSDIGALRKDPKYRKAVAKSADSILKKMKGYVS